MAAKAPEGGRGGGAGFWLQPEMFADEIWRGSEEKNHIGGDRALRFSSDISFQYSPAIAADDVDFVRRLESALILEDEMKSMSCNFAGQRFSGPTENRAARSPLSLEVLYAAAVEQAALVRARARARAAQQSDELLYSAAALARLRGRSAEEKIYALPLLHQQKLKFEQLKREQMIKHQNLSRVQAIRQSYDANFGDKPLTPESTLRAVLLNETRRPASAGTGVFLPQRARPQPQKKKKSGCSTALLPERVVQALKLNMDEIGTRSRVPGMYVFDNDGIAPRGNRSHYHLTPPPAAAQLSHEVRLPEEWTY